MKSSHGIPASQVCHDFADFLVCCEGVPILDEFTLPYPKEEIFGSFVLYAAFLKDTGQDALLEVIGGVLLRLNNCKYIEPKDRFLVAAINRGEGLFWKWHGNPTDWPEPQNHNERESQRIFTEMISKYSL